MRQHTGVPFVSRKIFTYMDELVDTDGADLKRLLSLSGHVTDDRDPVLSEQLVAGLSKEYALQMRMTYA